MHIEKFVVGYLQTNTYVVYDDTKTAAIVDPGGGYVEIKKYLDDNGLTLTAVLLTHGHFDHIAAVKKFQSLGAKVYMHILDGGMAKNKESLADEVGLELESFIPDKLLINGDVIEVGEMRFKLLHTPGHTRGSSCYIIDDVIFSGDTLFFESYGRTDFFGGSIQDMLSSMRKLFRLEGDYTVYPGHMKHTTLEHERNCNPLALKFAD